ncbi:charged multivesicular body protein 2a [Anaeramoeba ignava]|uniref:Charged multivesicular body protein 2a n=1 Tax=Anaeramoeba ignava TaxID=1746090 RepID=A0A9Q0LY48_ANAIG|nr:charged multivesicular body protein 2a [Anaeramoeba ignava]
MGIFGSKKSPEELLKEYQKLLRKSQREIERERMKLQRQEKTIIADMKKMAKEGQANSCKIMAKDLVRTRHTIQKFYRMKAQLQAVSLRIQTMRSSATMTKAMRGTAKAMAAMNRATNIPFMQTKEETMEDTLDDIFEESGEEDEVEEEVGKVFEELKINLVGQLENTPVEAQKNTDVQANDLEKRLANLKNNN